MDWTYCRHRTYGCHMPIGGWVEKRIKVVVAFHLTLLHCHPKKRSNWQVESPVIFLLLLNCFLKSVAFLLLLPKCIGQLRDLPFVCWALCIPPKLLILIIQTMVNVYNSC
jgi:hypothetical protein